MARIIGRLLMSLGLVLTAAACGGDDSPLVGDSTTTAPQATIGSSPTTTTVADNATSSTTEAMQLEPCDPSTTEIDIGVEVQGEAQGTGDSVYYCLEIPDGVEGVMVTLTGLTADLDLWMAHPDLETLANGGFDFWFSDQNGTVDEFVDISPLASTGFVRPGRYYIEVSSGQEPSSFTLLVETTS